jgi:DNA-binding transcriptional ArsR family regulator
VLHGKDDARYSTLAQLHERRKQVVRLPRKGYGVMQIVELCGLSYPTVRGAIDRYEEGGLAAIKPATRGKFMGQWRTLTEDQEREIPLIICDKRPEQLKMEFALWSRSSDAVLPSYSPEWNPEERLNADLKHAIGTKVPVHTKAKLKLAASEHMTKLEQSPERVKSFFQDPRVKYVA